MIVDDLVRSGKIAVALPLPPPPPHYHRHRHRSVSSSSASFAAAFVAAAATFTYCLHRTTGGTLYECGKALRAAGASRCGKDFDRNTRHTHPHTRRQGYGVVCSPCPPRICTFFHHILALALPSQWVLSVRPSFHFCAPFCLPVKPHSYPCRQCFRLRCSRSLS